MNFLKFIIGALSLITPIISILLTFIFWFMSFFAYDSGSSNPTIVDEQIATILGTLGFIIHVISLPFATIVYLLIALINIYIAVAQKWTYVIIGTILTIPIPFLYFWFVIIIIEFNISI